MAALTGPRPSQPTVVAGDDDSAQVLGQVLLEGRDQRQREVVG